MAFREECGVFGVWNSRQAAQSIFLGLFALQHRGQESAGISVLSSWQTPHMEHHKGLGLVGEVFEPSVLSQLSGVAGIGHVRYSTTGQNLLTNAQPLSANLFSGPVALAHNGNLTNASQLRKELQKKGSIFQGSNDTEVLLHLIAQNSSDQMIACLQECLPQIEGAFSLLILTHDRLIAIRDSRGFRPLVLGRKISPENEETFFVASETCALDLVGADFVREINPGEILEISRRGLQSYQWASETAKAQCVFEHVYFSRPDSIVFGESVYQVRQNMGKWLAKESFIEADVVVPIPDGGIPAALGFSRESGIPFELGIIRNHYIGRTFIQPLSGDRHLGVQLKLNPQISILKDRRVVVVDDSLVRGTTSRNLIHLIRQAGAKEVHLRIASPPTIGSCYYGVDTSDGGELIARSQSLQEICNFVGADSLEYLSLQGLLAAVRENSKSRTYCSACFDEAYPTVVSSTCHSPKNPSFSGDGKEQFMVSN